MSSSSDLTQAIPPSSGDGNISHPNNGVVIGEETSIQTATLPSTAIGGNNDTNKISGDNPAGMAAVTTVAAFPFAQAPQALAEYHKPMMSQMDGTLFDDSALFGDSDAPAASNPVVVPDAPHHHEENPNGHLLQPVDPVEEAVQPTETGSTDIPVSAAKDADTIAETASSDPTLAIENREALTDAHHAEQMDADENVDLMDTNHAVDTDDESQTEERSRVLAAMSEMAAEANAGRVETEHSPPKRSTRRRRPVSASQGVTYSYHQDGTLGNDSEDEDGGWNEDDEVRATQQFLAPKLSFGSDDEEDVGHSNGHMEVDDEHEADEASPKAKRRKMAETSSDAPHGVDAREMDDDVEYVRSTTAKKASSTDVSVIESDDENEPRSKPRPSLGNLSKPAATSNPPTPKRSKKATAAVKEAKPKKSALVVVEEESIEHDERELRATPTSSHSKKSEPSTPVSKSKPPGSTLKSKKAPSRDLDLSVTDDNEAVEEAVTRPKRSRGGDVKSPAAKGKKKEIEPTADLARAMRQNARESIAKYLQDHSEDMDEYFTQHVLRGKAAEAVDPPPTLFKRFSFIVSGLRATGDVVAAADFIKLQIKVLGGRIVNFRKAKRKTEASIKTAIKRRVSNGEPLEDVTFEENMPQYILISDKPQRTLKYVAALASCVPCVHFRWFLACLHNGKLLPLNDYLLPSGYNEDAALVPTPHWFCQENLDNVPIEELSPFTITYNDEDIEGEAESTQGKTKKKKRPSDEGESFRVEIIGTSAFRSQWDPLLKEVGAQVVQRMDAARAYGRLDYVLSDSEPTDLMIKLASDRKLPLCTIDWALQTIIQRKVQDPLSKPAYTLDLEE